ncbi:MAG: hydroxymethylglutaryl-CoA reductase, degradative [Deltaproteobacteria bacterium]|nr:hydroxymethylglutaryl-CoA reductase, degradative [Deltaproteobacteria bacterium]
MSDTRPSSRLPGFYRIRLDERQTELARQVGLSPDELALLASGGISAADADHIVENVVGVYALPLGLGLNFRINGVDRLIPMAVEEPSVVAAASNAARMARAGGGFAAQADESIMIAQIELRDVENTAAATAALQAARAEIVAKADATLPQLLAFGGGCRDLEIRTLPDRRLVVHLHIDCRDAMGANMVNTVAEALAPRLAELARGRIGLRILSNLADRRLVRATTRVPFAALAGDKTAVAGEVLAKAIAGASRFAEDDPYRAATHNKGIMNGVDPVVIATGNDWRGIEAGAHAYAARDGRYRPLATWRVEGDALAGRLEMPMALGTVGGTLAVHPGARLALRVLGVGRARELAEIVASVGLAQNLAALRALAGEGIQRGHMALHRRAVGEG